MATIAEEPHMQRTPALQIKQKVYTPLVVQELQGIEDRLGGRAGLVGMLVLAPLTPDLSFVLGMLGDPLNVRLSLAEICARGNILPGDLLKELGAAALLSGQIAAKQKIGEGIAKVAEDLMRKAVPYEAACGECQGTGTFTPEPTPQIPNPSPGPCDVCRGTGKLIYQPSFETQKFVVEMAHLLPKSGGIQIGVQQNNGQASGGGSLSDKLQLLSDDLLYRDRRPAPPAVDADPAIEGDLVP